MKQVLQDLASGKTIVADVPVPNVRSGHVLIQSHVSLVSAGTERMLVDFGRSGYLEKARQQPEKVKMVLDKIRTDGLLPTIDAVRSKLDQPIPMGYSNVGTVVEVGAGVTEFKVGDLVASNGNHAETVCVPKNLCAKVPTGIDAEDAAFTVIGSIALQGIRLASPTMGESFVVTGLGLVGLMTVQLLLAQGCRVLGIDFDQRKLELAKSYGAQVVDLSKGENPLVAAESFSRGRGVDGVLLTASTKSSDPVSQAATMCRKRGRIVLVGVTGLELNRADFFEKELSFQVSCSYGPGRYDEKYEQKGDDYPIGFVRWTEQRNFEAVLDLMASGKLTLDALKNRKFSIESAPDAYDFLMHDKSALGILLTYDTKQPAKDRNATKTVQLKEHAPDKLSAKPTLGVIGAGNYLGRVLLPAFSKTSARLKSIASSGGISGTHYGKKLGFESSTTDSETIFDDPEINTIVVGTQHNSHAHFTQKALRAGKSVFVEKPLALSRSELSEIKDAYEEGALVDGKEPILMVGFNRRFAPLMKKLKAAVQASSTPMSIVYTCNAGHLPADSWVQDIERGGGRIVGEACHFIDIARFLVGAQISNVTASSMRTNSEDCFDTATISVTFADGSMATIHYFANGHKSFPKERVEVFQAGNIFILDNFRKLKSYGSSAVKASTRQQDKGQTACCKSFIDALASEGPSPVAFEELMEVSEATINAWEQIISS